MKRVTIELGGKSPNIFFKSVGDADDDFFDKAVEGAEDNPQLAEQDLQAIGFSARDILVGIAASGRTPYVLGGLAYAQQQGAVTVAISCNASAPILEQADIAIVAAQAQVIDDDHGPSSILRVESR